MSVGCLPLLTYICYSLLTSDSTRHLAQLAQAPPWSMKKVVYEKKKANHCVRCEILV